MTNVTIVSRKIRFTSPEGSVYNHTRAHVEKRIKEMSGKKKLRPSSRETLDLYRRAAALARAKGL